MRARKYFDITIDFVDKKVPAMKMRAFGVGIDGDKLTISSIHGATTTRTVPLENVSDVTVRLGTPKT